MIKSLEQNRFDRLARQSAALVCARHAAIFSNSKRKGVGVNVGKVRGLAIILKLISG